MKRLWQRLFLLVVVDLGCFYLSLVVSYLIRVYLLPAVVSVVPPNAYSLNLLHYLSLWWMPLLFVLFSGVDGLYTRRFYFWSELARLWKTDFMFTVVVFSVVALGKISSQISRLTVVIMFFALLVLHPFIRYYGKLFLLKLGVWSEDALIVGAGGTGRALLSGLRRQKTMGYRVVGFLDDNVDGVVDGVPVVGKLSELGTVLEGEHVATVFLAIPSMGMEGMKKLFDVISMYAPNVYVVPDMLGIPSLNSELYYMFYEGLFVIYTKNKLLSFWRKWVKRLFDVVVVLLTLPITLPLIGVLGLLVLLDSGYPVFFVMDRIGEKGKTFRCIKFRSMYNNADRILDDYLNSNPEEMDNWKMFKKVKGNDPRVTKIGRFLRRTSLDELPQIFNVLKGDMSLVGPRPYLPREKREMLPYFDRIVSVKPGITGLWQVSGRNNLSFADRVKLDVWYVRNWSLWLDFVIILKTVAVVFRREGAY